MDGGQAPPPGASRLRNRISKETRAGNYSHRLQSLGTESIPRRLLGHKMSSRPSVRDAEIASAWPIMGVMALLPVSQTLPGWLAAQFPASASTPPSVRSDRMHG